MNRKGFAITTVIYGLALLGIMIITMLMGILSSTRNNITRESDRIEKVLINYNMSSKEFKGSASAQEYITPDGETGWYRIEAFGASGNNNGDVDDITNGAGAYTTGIIYLKEKEKLKIETGLVGATTETKVSLVRTVNDAGEIKPKEFLLMRAAGGSGSSPGGTLMNQDITTKGAQIDRESSDLSSGTLIGTETIKYNNASSVPSQIIGYPWNCSSSDCNSKITASSVGSDYDYFFVDGLMLPAVNVGNGKVIIQRIKEDEEYNEYLIKQQTTSGITLTAPDTPIKRIPRTNKKFNNVKKITITTPSNLTVDKAYYTSEGIVKEINSGTELSSPVNIDDLAVTFTQKNVNLGGVTIKLTNADNTENIIYSSIFLSSERGIYSTPTGIKLSAYQPDSTTEITPHGNYYIIPITIEGYAMSTPSIAKSGDGLVGIEHLNGESRQKWSIDKLNDPNKTDGEANFKDIRNESGMNEYRILELARSKALGVYRDENRQNGTIAANQTFNAISRNGPHIWNIRPNSDGTFSIKTAEPSLDPSSRSGYLFANTTIDADHRLKVLIGKARTNKTASSETTPGDPTPTSNTINETDTSMQATQVQRFILYSIDFSTSQEG